MGTPRRSRVWEHGLAVLALLLGLGAAACGADGRPPDAGNPLEGDAANGDDRDATMAEDEGAGGTGESGSTGESGGDAAVEVCSQLRGEFFAELREEMPDGIDDCRVGPWMVPLDSGQSGVRVTTRRYPDRQIEVEVRQRGCELSVQVKETTPEGTRQAVATISATIESDNAASGTALVERFDETGANVECQGWQEVTLARIPDSFDD